METAGVSRVVGAGVGAAEEARPAPRGAYHNSAMPTWASPTRRRFGSPSSTSAARPASALLDETPGVVPRVGRQPHQEGWHAGRARRDDAELGVDLRIMAVPPRLDRFRTHLPLPCYRSLKLLPAVALLPVACVEIKFRAPHAIDAMSSP